MSPYDIDAAEDWLDGWTASVSAQAERAAVLSRRVAALTGSAQSSDGSIKVTVGSSGQVEKLELDDRVHQVRGPELAERIVSVMRQAQARLARQVSVEVEQTVGSDTETGRAVIHSFETRFPEAERGDGQERDDAGR
uniref:YbaB/EbfC family nucleoid-associated protein n=1 Tax=Paractinoplanes polyasparticus TaxID=2856853 RepID=UPI001C85530F|nr:YbaB/EbfC family nucleoid-associated protein [Actinoplanes polyasparticus]